jgi:hypothetical protein
MDFTAHAMSSLERGFVAENFKPFTLSASSESVMIRFKRLKKNVFEPEASVLLIVYPGEFTNMARFLRDKVQKTSNSECYTPSQEKFRLTLVTYYYPSQTFKL